VIPDRAALLGKVSEKQTQASIVKLASLFRWQTYHTFDSRRSTAGFPDLLLCRPPRVIAAEVKTERGNLSAAQAKWLALLEECGVEVHVWRPSMMDQITECLR
jgi:hypothetical protein